VTADPLVVPPAATGGELILRAALFAKGSARATITAVASKQKTLPLDVEVQIVGVGGIVRLDVTPDADVANALVVETDRIVVAGTGTAATRASAFVFALEQ